MLVFDVLVLTSKSPQDYWQAKGKRENSSFLPGESLEGVLVEPRPELCGMYDKLNYCLPDLQDQAIIVKEDHSPDESDNPNNWKYFNGNVPAVIQRYHRNGYNVMVFR